MENFKIKKTSDSLKFIVYFFTESSKLCLKDLSDDVTTKLSEMLQADKAALEKFYQFFGLEMGGRYPLKEIKQMFPDTAVGVVKECFEVLRLYDLVEILEKVRPRSLRPAVSPEQIEKLRRAGGRPTKYHSDVAVLIVNLTIEEDIVETEHVEKIETFFKDLNSQNEVALISLDTSQETRELLGEIKKRNHGKLYDFRKGSYTIDLEHTLRQMDRLEKELEDVMQMEEGDEQRQNDLERRLSLLKKDELSRRCKLEDVVKEIEQAKRDFEKLEKDSITKPISTAMDEWIHNQGWLTSYAYRHTCTYTYMFILFEKGSRFNKTLRKANKVTIESTLKIIERRKKKLFGN